jgi:2-polyprenyl-6-methoxyphenol hydroxylase-like FAD-dependent oxidoreductase
MSNAFRDADLVAGAIAAHCDVGGATDQLAAFEATRIRDTWPIYRFGQQVAGFSPTPELVRVLLRLREDQRGIDRFIGALSGTVPATSFFAVDDLEASPDPEVVAG